MDKLDLNKKRASNMIWTASNNYDLKPLLLFYTKDGEPSIYSNTMEGLAYLCLREDVIVPFLRGIMSSYDPDRYITYALLVLEMKIYRSMITDRPSLENLREDYAALRLGELGMVRRYHTMGPERLEALWAKMVLDDSYLQSEEIRLEFKSQEIRLFRELMEASALNDEKLVAKIKELLLKHYFYKWIPSRQKETAHFLGAGMLIALFGNVGADGIVPGGADENGDSDDMEYAPKQKTTLLGKLMTHAVSKTTPEEDLEFVKQTFGPQIVADQVTIHASELFCRGYHKESRLWYAGMYTSKDLFHEEQEKQRRKNIEFYQENRRLYERSIREISQRIKHELEAKLEPDNVHMQSGILEADRVYRIQYLHDLNVFHREIIFPAPDLSIDLLLDASSSRVKDQREIATQAYIITRALQELEIPVQVSTFRSLRGYTILQKFTSYEDFSDPEAIFHYYAAGSNRDGLALRAIRTFMDQGEKLTGQTFRKKILLVLTDATPADTLKAWIGDSNEGGIISHKDYDEELAVHDTREAVLELRRENINVSAIFWGQKRSVPDLKKIYGDNFIRIIDIAQLSDAVIGLLLKAIK